MNFETATKLKRAKLENVNEESEPAMSLDDMFGSEDEDEEAADMALLSKASDFGAPL